MRDVLYLVIIAAMVLGCVAWAIFTSTYGEDSPEYREELARIARERESR
jgi:hypothetical protein